VHRLFAEYASGKSPRLIAADLMRDKVPSPTGSAFWNYQTIVGGAGKKRGLINNPLYVGVYLKNRTYNVKNPSTGKTITREANPDDLIRAEVPHLRIIDQKLWDAAHKVRAGRRNTMLGKVSQRAVVPRKQHLLANLLRCSECNGRMVINSSDRHSKKGVCCSAAHTKQSCSHRKTNNLDKISALAVEELCERLSDPELLKERAGEGGRGSPP
jgi:site-specific DNA recombinase